MQPESNPQSSTANHPHAHIRTDEDGTDFEEHVLPHAGCNETELESQGSDTYLRFFCLDLLTYPIMRLASTEAA